MTDRTEKFIEQAYKKLSECNDIDSLYDKYMEMVTLPTYGSFEYIYACGKALQRREEELEKEGDAINGESSNSLHKGRG